MTKHTILFLAANPLGTGRLALDQEARAIQDELERSDHRDQFELVTRWAAQPLDLLRELRRLKPTIVHFSGHGGRGGPSGSGQNPVLRRDVCVDGVPGIAGRGDHQDGLFFLGSHGRPQLVSTAALKETFGAVGASVRLVVLAACYSEVQARALLTHVDCVVGMNGAIGDDAARNFAIGFYGGLGARESIALAFDQGRAAISLQGLSDGEAPCLKARRGIDVNRLVLANVGSPKTEPGERAAYQYQATARTWDRDRQLALKFILGRYTGAEVSLPSFGIVRIGRRCGLEIELIDDIVSRMHAQIIISDKMLAITDHASATRTFVNGEPVVQARCLELGDRILLGTSMARLTYATGDCPSLEEAGKLFQLHQSTAGLSLVGSVLQRSGLIGDIPILERLHILSISRVSGVVIFCETESKSGIVYLLQGDIRAAIIQYKNEHQENWTPDGLAAFFEIILWKEGIFEIHLKSPTDLLRSLVRINGIIEYETEQLFADGVRLCLSTQSEYVDSPS